MQPIEVEEFLGFVFVRFKPGGLSVAERFASYRTEMKAYRTAEMVSRGTGWLCDIAVDWKNLIDNYHKKNRRGRAAPLNMVITETGAELFMPQSQSLETPF